MYEVITASCKLKGAIAQLGERLPCTQEVRSSILLGSTITRVQMKDYTDVTVIFHVYFM